MVRNGIAKHSARIRWQPETDALLMQHTADIVVVGGGMVGAMTALAFAHCDLKVALVEKKAPPPFDSGKHDIRVSAISHATLEMLKAVGAWDSILKARVCPYKRMLVWDSGSTAKTRFNSADVGYQQLGFIVENSLIQYALWQQLRELPDVDIQCPASITVLELQQDGAFITLDNGKTIRSELIVAADGAQSTLRSLAGIKTDGESYQQHALVATVKTEIPQQDITWQRFTETGPQAFLPLAGQRASMVWYHSEARIAELKALAEADFIEAMEAEFPDNLGGLVSVEQRGSFPLQWCHAKQYVKPRLALVGDAAHAVHPLAGQGVNLGMLDSAVLVQCVLDGIKKGRAPGDLRVLRRYERWRKPSNHIMIKALNGIQQAFQPREPSAIQNGVLKAARTTALRIADSVGPINKTLIRSAMGLSGELPELALGRLPVSDQTAPG